MAMNHYAIQIFHARLKVRFLKYDVNLGSQQWIIIQKSAFLLFECVTRDSTSKQKQEKFFTVSRLIKAFKITFLSLLPQKTLLLLLLLLLFTNMNFRGQEV